MIAPEPKTSKKKPKTSKTDRRSHKSLALSLKKKEQELCVLNNSATEDSDKKIHEGTPYLQKNNFAPEEEVDSEELQKILESSEMTGEALTLTSERLSTIYEADEGVSCCPSRI